MELHPWWFGPSLRCFNSYWLLQNYFLVSEDRLSFVRSKWDIYSSEYKKCTSCFALSKIKKFAFWIFVVVFLELVWPHHIQILHWLLLKVLSLTLERSVVLFYSYSPRSLIILRFCYCLYILIIDVAMPAWNLISIWVLIFSLSCQHGN